MTMERRKHWSRKLHYLARLRDLDLESSSCCRHTPSVFLSYDLDCLENTTGSSKINGAKFSDACSVRANWLAILLGRNEAGVSNSKIFCTTLYIFSFSDFSM